MSVCAGKFAVGGCFLAGCIMRFLPGMRFSAFLFWMLGFLCVTGIVLNKLSQKSGFFKVCKCIFLCTVALGFTAFLLLEAAVLSGKDGAIQPPEADAVIVLGAGVNGDTPSLTLQSRIDAAARYLREHPKTPAVLSGGQGDGESVSEARAMYRALTAQAIPASQLLLEERSSNTAENFAFSKAVLEANGVDLTHGKIAVVSSDFHLFRAGVLAKHEGLSTFGIPARLPWRGLAVNYEVREAFALAKTLILDIR